MTIFFHELKRGALALIIWIAAIAAMLSVCILIYPQMEPQMSEITDAFADMGSFTSAFGMDKLNFGEFKGYFAIECGNSLGLGGALFAAVLGIGMLSKEQGMRTADFLLTHPLTRRRIVFEKLLSVYAQIVIFNAVIVLFTVLSIFIIGEKFETKPFLMLFLAYFLLQIEIASVCFGISAFLSNPAYGLGIGIALIMYFLSLIASITDKTAFLKYLTPFGFADSANIVNTGKIEIKHLLSGAAIAVLSVAAAFIKYDKKDI